MCVIFKFLTSLAPNAQIKFICFEKKNPFNLIMGLLTCSKAKQVLEYTKNKEEEEEKSYARIEFEKGNATSGTFRIFVFASVCSNPNNNKQT